MDVEKTIEFILEQNALNTVQIAELREVALAHESDLQVHTEWKTEMSQIMQDLASQMKNGFDKLTLKHAQLADRQLQLADQQGQLVDQQAQLVDKHAALADKHAALADKHAELTDNLNILIRTVQDMIPRLPK